MTLAGAQDPRQFENSVFEASGRDSAGQEHPTGLSCLLDAGRPSSNFPLEGRPIAEPEVDTYHADAALAARLQAEEEMHFQDVDELEKELGIEQDSPRAPDRAMRTGLSL